MTTPEGPVWQPGIRNPDEVYEGVELTPKMVPGLLAISRTIKPRSALLSKFDGSTATAIAGVLPFYLEGKPDTPEWRNRFEDRDFISFEGRIYPAWPFKEIILLSQHYPEVFDQIKSPE